MLVTAVCTALACVTRAPGTVDPLRISEVAEQGDAARRASTRLVLEGLDADAEGDPVRARGIYDRALQVDPNNPYAYLAIARHHADGTEPERALSYLDRAMALFEMEGQVSPGVKVQLVGLRGQSLYSSGRFEEGRDDLEQARKLAPEVWTDGGLEPDELR